MNQKPTLLSEQVNRDYLGWHAVKGCKTSHFFGWYNYKSYVHSLCDMTVSIEMVLSPTLAPACKICRDRKNELDQELKQDVKDET